MTTTVPQEVSPSEVKFGTGYRDAWVMANGVKTHYYQAGDEGPAVVLLHGGAVGVSGEAGWREMMPALAPYFRVYAVDQLSFGWTDKRPHAWPTLGHQSLVDHVADFVEALCLEDVMVAGNSQGAYIAAKYTLDHPDKVSKLFLIGSGSISQAFGLRHGSQPAPSTTPAPIEYDSSPEAVREHLEEIIYNKQTLTPELIRHRTAVANLPGAREARIAFWEGVARRRQDPKLQQQFTGIRDGLPKLPIPTMFIWGKQDTFAPVELGYELEKLCQNIKFQYIDECGHQCQNDQPEVTNKIILDFFRS